MNGLDTNAITPMINSALLQGSQNKINAISRNLDNAQADEKKYAKAAEEFEAVFISEMIKPMFEGIESDGMFGGGKGEEVFRGFMITEYGKMIAASGGIGLADHIKDTMINLQAEAEGRIDKFGRDVTNNEVTEEIVQENREEGDQ